MMPLQECNQRTAECCLIDYGLPEPQICYQGAVAPLAVNATKPEHVEAAVKFAA